MFQVQRYDPREEDRRKSTKKKRSPERVKDDKKKSKKHRPSRQPDIHNDDNDNDNNNNHDSEKLSQLPPTPALRVIAPEAPSTATSKQKKLNTKLNEEAFDDLGVDLDAVIEEDVQDEEEVNPSILPPPTVDFDPTDEVQRALHMSRLPIEEAARRWGLAPFLVSNLVEEGHAHFFPIQALVIPDVILAEEYDMRARDICVAAPTGSGKTLAFVLPVLNALAHRQVRRLRALVVLPSRDLAKQVYQVFERYAKGSDLKIGLSLGQSDFRTEQTQLLLGGSEGEIDNSDHRSSTKNLAHLQHLLNPGSLPLALEACREQLEYVSGAADGGKSPPLPQGGISAVDVLVCTPGRLVDHCDNTPGFTLQHLRFLVIDEADRLLSQSYHGWIARVFDSAKAASRNMATLDNHKDLSTLASDPMTWRLSDGGGGGGAGSTYMGNVGTLCRPVQLRKLLYSATLSKDPQKLAALTLVNPKHFNAHHLTERGKQVSSAL